MTKALLIFATGVLVGALVAGRIYRPILDDMRGEVAELYGMRVKIDAIARRQIQCEEVRQALGLPVESIGGPP